VSGSGHRVPTRAWRHRRPYAGTRAGRSCAASFRKGSGLVDAPRSGRLPSAACQTCLVRSTTNMKFAATRTARSRGVARARPGVGELRVACWDGPLSQFSRTLWVFYGPRRSRPVLEMNTREKARQRRDQPNRAPTRRAPNRSGTTMTTIAWREKGQLFTIRKHRKAMRGRWAIARRTALVATCALAGLLVMAGRRARRRRGSGSTTSCRVPLVSVQLRLLTALRTPSG
jgi:hypothetical protein